MHNFQDIQDIQDMQKEYIVFIRLFKSNKMSVSISANMKTEVNGFRGSLGPNSNFITKIVYYEVKKSKRQALAREKELKNLNRKGLTSVVKASNPEMLDLSSTWEEDNSFYAQNGLNL